MAAKYRYQPRVPERFRESRSLRFFRPLLYRLSYLGGDINSIGFALTRRAAAAISNGRTTNGVANDVHEKTMVSAIQARLRRDHCSTREHVGRRPVETEQSSLRRSLPRLRIAETRARRRTSPVSVPSFPAILAHPDVRDSWGDTRCYAPPIGLSPSRVANC